MKPEATEDDLRRVRDAATLDDAALILERLGFHPADARTIAWHERDPEAANDVK